MAAHIDVDGYNLALEEGTGVATYARNLTVALGQMGVRTNVLYGHRMGAGADPFMKEIRFFDPFVASKTPFLNWPGDVWRLIKCLGGVRAFEVPITGKVVADDFRGRLPRYDKILNANSLYVRAHDWFDLTGRSLEITVPQPPQVMHWTYPLPVRVKGAKNIYTLHDLVPLRLPHTTLDKKRRYLSLMRLLAREADHLVTVSEASRRDIMELLGVPENRVTNTYQAAEVPAELLSPQGVEIGKAIEQAFGLHSGAYYLFFGAVEPKKNVARLIQGFLAAQTDARLVIVGKKAWKYKKQLALLEMITETGGQQIIHLDYMPYAMLVSLIRGAKGVLFPSLYEGFGLPVLEAFQVGTPVLTSNTASLPEVAGDAALAVDPYDPGAIAEGIRRLDREAKLRADLVRKGKVQAAKFSHEAYRERLRGLYGRLGVSL